jgi:hypothetical protein
VNQPDDALARDLQALRYLDALDAGDLAAVAAQWEEASRVPELEELLTELDAALFQERAAVPTTRPRRALWIGVAGALAAACLLAALLWARRDRPAPAPGREAEPIASHDTQHPPSDRVVFPESPWDLRGDGAETLGFHWPLGESKPIAPSTSISPDLFD